MSKVLKHAIIYTGLEKIDDGYIRFGKKLKRLVQWMTTWPNPMMISNL